MLAALTGAAALPYPAAAGAPPNEAVFEPHVLEISDGARVDAELARLAVPEKRDAKESREIELALIRLKGRAAGRETPILYLGGSPSGAPSSRALRLAQLYPFFDALRRSGDVIVLDYRGSGLSTPRLQCPAAGELDPNLFSSRESGRAGLSEDARQCAAALRADGVQLSGYTWAEVSHDVADVRRALRAAKLHLVGFSSGTHAALATIRSHPEIIDRVVLIGTEGLDHTRKLPNNVDTQLTRIDRLVSADPELSKQLPDFLGTVRSVLRRAEQNPFEIELVLPQSKSRVRAKISRFALEYVTSKSISGPEEFGILPRLYATLARGDVSVLTHIFQRFADRPGMNPLAFIMDGASGVSRERAALIQKQARSAILGNAVNFPFPEIRAAWGYPDLGSSFRTPVRSGIPALFVTGELDGNTPVAQAEEVRRGFPRSSHIVIHNGGHDSAFTSSEAAVAIAAFLQGRDVSKLAVSVPAPAFAPIDVRSSDRS